MHTVRYITNVQFIREVTFPNWGEHTLRNLTVQPAYAVSLLASVQGEYAHGEFLVRARVLTSHIDEVLPANT